MNKPTRPQETTLAVIASLTLLRGEAPTHLEIARALGVTRQAVTERLAWMSKKGLVRMNHGRWSRTSGLTREGAMALAERLAPPAAAV